MEFGQNDLLLSPFLRASSEAEAESVLAELVTAHAAPIVSKIVRFKSRSVSRNGSSGSDEAEDVQSEVMLQLVQRLKNFRFDHETRPINDFKSYVAAATYNAFDRHISRKYPQRRRLKNGLRYLLTHRENFGCWQTANGSWVGGYDKWQSNSFVGTESKERLIALRGDFYAFARETNPPASWRDEKGAYELLSAIFAWANAPVDIDLLTSVVAEWWNVTDETVEIDGGATNDAGEKSSLQIADKSQNVQDQTEQRAFLQRMWTEIADLPERQRAALLLNLRDANGRGIVDLWLLINVCTVRQIAEALNMTAEALAELWNDLPLDDNRIAAHLSLTRQQVINLRKSARERLARRMKES